MITQYSFSKTSVSTPNCKKYSSIISTPSSDEIWIHRDKPLLSDTSYIKQSNFFCIECIDGYFLNLETSLCEMKNNIDPLCEETESNSNRCKKCKPEGFLMRVEGVCDLSPNREKDCSKYSEMGICLECTNNTYPVTIVLDKFGDRFTDPQRYTPCKSNSHFNFKP